MGERRSCGRIGDGLVPGWQSWGSSRAGKGRREHPTTGPASCEGHHVQGPLSHKPACEASTARRGTRPSPGCLRAGGEGPHTGPHILGRHRLPRNFHWEPGLASRATENERGVPQPSDSSRHVACHPSLLLSWVLVGRFRAFLHSHWPPRSPLVRSGHWSQVKESWGQGGGTQPTWRWPRTPWSPPRSRPPHWCSWEE